MDDLHATPPPDASTEPSEAVRCLDCGAVYSKPAAGGTVTANPGCPECGYLGWLSISIPFSEDAPLRRSVAGRPLHLPA
jgi:hypothetical protein